MSTNNPDQPNDLNGELSLLDITEFIQESWKTITGFAVLGIVSATLYLWAVPKQYEAIARIKMAQLVNVNNNNNNNINVLGISIEEPQALIARMALPTSYSKETIELCGLANQKDADALLVKKVKFSIPKGVGGIVDLRIRDASKETAKACAIAIYQLIKTSQAQLINPYINESNKKLAIVEEHLTRIIQVILKADKSGAATTPIYYAPYVEISYLLDRISNLQNIITGNESRSTHLVAPIYVEDLPVFPKTLKSLLIGLIIGGGLGLILGLVRKWYRSITDHK